MAALKTVTLSDGTVLPALGQGTWFVGDDPWRRDAEIATLREGIDLGLTLVDTAEMYGDGRSEDLVGEAIAPVRDRVYLVDKVLPCNASRRGAVQACERSLDVLGTEVEGVPVHDGQRRRTAHALRQQDVEASVHFISQVEVEKMAAAAAPGMIENEDGRFAGLPRLKSTQLRLSAIRRRHPRRRPGQMVEQGLSDLHADIAAAIGVGIEGRRRPSA